MNPVLNKKHHTMTYYPPRNWDTMAHGVCNPLPVHQENGLITSYWQPSAIDRLRVAFGGRLRLVVMADRMPPVKIDTDDGGKIAGRAGTPLGHALASAAAWNTMLPHGKTPGVRYAVRHLLIAAKYWVMGCRK